MATPVTKAHETAGIQDDQINVKISHRIIQLFSEGLYSSPNKAIEELVSNSFDANAKNVHVVLSPDLRDPDATIAVVDDGEGMDRDGLKTHWVIGRSTRRAGDQTKRKPIGKFGIGKLSTFVLATKLTHICKDQSNYYAATMDYSRMAPSAVDTSGGVFDEETINIPLRVLTEDEAKIAVTPWTNGDGQGYQSLPLFGESAPESWTVAIMSDLKEMGKKIKIGRLEWVLRTAMPQYSDFHLFLDGAQIEPPKLAAPLKKYVIGKDVVQLPAPCPEGLIAREDESAPKASEFRYGIYDNELLGRITGYIEIFEEELDRGKDKFQQSAGFFVYVRGRRVNVDDSGFGIERNLLRHGTFSRFRMVVHVDSLDEALRSSRESFQQGELYDAVQNYLRAGFNYARNRLVEYDREQTPAARMSLGLAAAPGSMTRKPLLALARLIAESKATPFYLRFPTNLTGKECQDLLESIQKGFDDDAGLLKVIELRPLDSREGVAVLYIETGTLLLNTSHPFVAAFQEYFADANKSLPLEIIALSEVLFESHLYQMGLDESVIRDAVGRHDQLLREFVRSSARRTAGMIALALTEARDDENELEKELRSAFEAMGFANVIRIGGKGNPDGTAEAHLAATEDGTVQRYKVGLEAKSGSKVSAARLNVSAIQRHMKDYGCDHHIVIANGFQTSSGEDSASVRSIRTYMEQTNRTITLIHIEDMARLVRIASAKRIGGLSRIREMFKACVTPEDSKEWVDCLEKEEPPSRPYQEILETIWKLAQEQPNEAVEYPAVVTELRHREPPVHLTKSDLKECCNAMQVLASGVVFARENSVEIDRRPDLILEDIRHAVGQYPEVERRTIQI